MVNKIKSKYYTYVPGEFMPIMAGDELLNRRAFHAYKLKRAAWLLQNPRLVYHHATHQRG